MFLLRVAFRSQHIGDSPVTATAVSKTLNTIVAVVRHPTATVVELRPFHPQLSRYQIFSSVEGAPEQRNQESRHPHARLATRHQQARFGGTPSQTRFLAKARGTLVAA